MDQLLRRRSLQHHTHVRPCQQQVPPFTIARHRKCLQAVALLSLGHRRDHSIPEKAGPPGLTLAVPLQKRRHGSLRGSRLALGAARDW